MPSHTRPDITAYAAEIAAQAPPLTTAQQDRITALLGGAK